MRPASAYVVCLLLTLATLGLRFTGLGFGVPIWEEPDPDIPGHVDMVREGWTTAAVEAPDEQYPHLVADLARWLPSRPPTSGVDAPKTLAEHLDAAAWTYCLLYTSPGSRCRSWRVWPSPCSIRFCTTKALARNMGGP